MPPRYYDGILTAADLTMTLAEHLEACLLERVTASRFSASKGCDWMVIPVWSVNSRPTFRPTSGEKGSVSLPSGSALQAVPMN